MGTWKLKKTTQCAKCPWLKKTKPNQIGGGYSIEKHTKLRDTIAKEGDLSFLSEDQPTLKIMACHETHDSHCVGWLNNQLGSGNNIQLRIAMTNCSNVGNLRTVGEQHENFEETLISAEKQK